MNINGIGLANQNFIYDMGLFCRHPLPPLPLHHYISVFYNTIILLPLIAGLSSLNHFVAERLRIPLCCMSSDWLYVGYKCRCPYLPVHILWSVGSLSWQQTHLEENHDKATDHTILSGLGAFNVWLPVPWLLCIQCVLWPHHAHLILKFLLSGFS